MGQREGEVGHDSTPLTWKRALQVLLFVWSGAASGAIEQLEMLAGFLRTFKRAVLCCSIHEVSSAIIGIAARNSGGTANGSGNTAVLMFVQDEVLDDRPPRNVAVIPCDAGKGFLGGGCNL